ncbi:MAG: hypothetical protein JO345_10395 [Streptosporangiaceae bacterium]|nr:hypothetical protein [Streptosporangiaceae bacterium]
MTFGVSLAGAALATVIVLIACVAEISRTVARPTPGAQSASGNAPGTGLLGRVLPYLTVVFAAFAPLATGIYLVTSIGWSIAERRLFHRREARKSPGAGPSVAPDRAKRGTVIPPGRPG